MKIFALLSAMALALFLAPAVAFAQAASPTATTIGWGDMLGHLGEFLGPLVAAAATAVVALILRKLPGPIAAFVTMLRIDQALEKAIAYAFNSVVGAKRGQTITIDTGNQLIANAMAYGLKHFPELIAAHMGDLTTLRDKIIARIDELPADFSDAIVNVKSVSG